MSYTDERGRVSTRLAGSIEHDGQRSAVAVRNLSVGGAMIESAQPLREGDRVRFDSDATGIVDASIVWVIGNRCGLMFDRPVLPNLSDAVIDTVAQAG
jgi:hypothetical protein